MAKKKQIGLLGAGAIAIASMMGAAQQANALNAPASQQQNAPSQQQNKKDAVIKIVNTQVERNRKGLHGGLQNPYKHINTPKKNQRQKRKFNRQNPNSKQL
jgi:hypothetical protein